MKTPLSRRLFLCALLVSYVLITSTVLLFIFGYRHDFVQKIFIYTGSLTVKTNPKDISITLNDKTPRSRLINVINNSYFITGLRPRKYKLSISTDEFKIWEKNVNIHSGISTEFWNIILLRKDYERTYFNIADIDQFFPAPAENLFACTRQMGKTFTVHVFDTKKNESVNAFILPQITFTRNEHENIEWSPTSKELIIPIIHTEKDHDKDYVIAYTKTNESFFLSDFIKYDNLRGVRWNPEEKDVIYFLSQNDLMQAKLIFDSQKIQPTKIAENVLAYDFADDGLYIINTDGELLYGGDKQGKNLKALTKFEISNTHNNYRLIAYDNHRSIVLDDTTGDFHLYNKGDKNIYTKKLSTNIVGAHFSDDGKKLLFHSPFEIFMYFTRDWETQPIRSEDQMQSIIRFSQIIDNVHFEKDYEHILFTVDNKIKIAELDYRGNRHTDTIIETTTNTTVINKHKMNKLFFIDSYDKAQRGLTSINFPEKETLF